MLRLTVRMDALLHISRAGRMALDMDKTDLRAAPRRADLQDVQALHGRDDYGSGTGTGLTIVKKLVKRHGGEVRVQSAPGQGTTFYFTLAPDLAAPT